MKRDYNAEIARCDEEIAVVRAYDGPDKYGATWGWVDWLVEKRLIEQAQEQEQA